MMPPTESAIPFWMVPPDGAPAVKTLLVTDPVKVAVGKTVLDITKTVVPLPSHVMT